MVRIHISRDPPAPPHAMMMTSKKCRRGQKKEQWLSQRGQVNKMINYLPVKRKGHIKKRKINQVMLETFLNEIQIRIRSSFLAPK